MAIYYLDFENGNDANSGTTFATRWKTLTSGATSGRIAPGDTIRIMASPSPTSLGVNGVWTSGVLQATKTISAATNATPIAITSSNHGYSTGDTITLSGVVGNEAANGTWEITVTGANTFTLNGSVGSGNRVSGGTLRLRNNTRIILSSPVTQSIASTGPNRVAWTASANVVTALNTADWREHSYSDSIDIGAAFTTGLAAYWPTGTLDLSGYQQVSFWIKQTAGTVGAAGSIELRLCSDTAGAVAVNTVSIIGLAATGRWTLVTTNLGVNLGSSIRSIAFYVNTDNGAQTFLINNIIACKNSNSPDSLNLASLIGKNTATESWWPIQSINGTRVMLDCDTNTLLTSTNNRGYYGISETITTWKRETIALGPLASTTTTSQVVNNSGTDGNPIVFSGGWDRTDMSTQTSETWLDGRNGNGLALNLTSREFVEIETLSLCRFNRALSFPGTASFCKFSFGSLTAFQTEPVTLPNTTSNCRLRVGFYYSSVASLVSFINSTSAIFSLDVEITNKLVSIPSNAISFNQSYYNVKSTSSTSALIANCSATGITTNIGATTVSNITFLDNGSYALSASGSVTDCYLNNCILSDTLEVFLPNYNPTRIFSQNHDGVVGNHKIFMDGGLISSATDQRKTPSGISWKLQPTSTVLRNSIRPVCLSLAKVACSANSLVTVKVWLYRDNASLNLRLICKGGQISGVPDDVATLATSTNSWQQVSISFTPTEIGVVEILAEAWGGTTFSGWVDDLTITQI